MLQFCSLEQMSSLLSQETKLRKEDNAMKMTYEKPELEVVFVEAEERLMNDPDLGTEDTSFAPF